MIGDQMFDKTMLRVYMTTVLNRNIGGNYMLDIIAGIKQKADEDQYMAEEQGMMTKMKRLLTKKKEEE